MSIDLCVRFLVGSGYGSKTARGIPGALSHVIARGNRRTTPPLHDAADDHAISPPGTVPAAGSSQCYAFILLANHVQVLVESKDVPLSRTMQTLQFTYA